MMTVVAVFEENVLMLSYGYSPQSRRTFEEKQSFYDQLKCEFDMHSTGDLSMCLVGFNRHIGRHGFSWVHGGHGIGQRNLSVCFR